ncbi:unnamed protein product [Adineta steineri]|nr:unnamed protein product [Adineta steineri]
MESKYTLNDVDNSNTSTSQSSTQVLPVFSPTSQNTTATTITSKLTRSMSGTFSSNVNFMTAQFLRRVGKLSVLQDIERHHEHDESGCSLELPKHHKRRHKKAASLYNRSQGFTDNLIQNTVQNTIFRSFNDAYKTLSVLDIDKTLKESHKSTLNEITTFVRVQIERKSHTTDYSENWGEYSDEEFDSKQANTSDDCYVRVNEITSSQINSYVRIKHDGKKNFMRKQTACWVLTDNKPTLSADRLHRVQ